MRGAAIPEPLSPNSTRDDDHDFRVRPLGPRHTGEPGVIGTVAYRSERCRSYPSRRSVRSDAIWAVPPCCVTLRRPFPEWTTRDSWEMSRRHASPPAAPWYTVGRRRGDPSLAIASRNCAILMGVWSLGPWPSAQVQDLTFRGPDSRSDPPRTPGPTGKVPAQLLWKVDVALVRRIPTGSPRGSGLPGRFVVLPGRNTHCRNAGWPPPDSPTRVPLGSQQRNTRLPKRSDPSQAMGISSAGSMTPISRAMAAVASFHGETREGTSPSTLG